MDDDGGDDGNDEYMMVMTAIITTIIDTTLSIGNMEGVQSTSQYFLFHPFCVIYRHNDVPLPFHNWSFGPHPQQRSTLKVYHSQPISEVSKMANSART